MNCDGRVEGNSKRILILLFDGFSCKILIQFYHSIYLKYSTNFDTQQQNAFSIYVIKILGQLIRFIKIVFSIFKSFWFDEYCVNKINLISTLLFFQYMQSTDFLGVQPNFLQTHCMTAQQQLTEFPFENAQEEIQIIESVETFNFEGIMHLMIITIRFKIASEETSQEKKKTSHTRQEKKKANHKENCNQIDLIFNQNRKHQPIPFNYVEDRQILLQVLELGPKFYKIAKSFPSRTLSMVKNRYYKTLRFQWDAILGQAYGHLNASDREMENQHSMDCLQELSDENIYSQILF